MTNRRQLAILALSAPLWFSTGCHRARPAATSAQPATSAPPATTNAAAPAASVPRRDNDSARSDAEKAAILRTLEEKIYFDFDRADLTVESLGVLETKLPLLRMNPDLRLRIEGNADDRGSDEYNLALGQRRAAAAKRFFVLRDINANRIDIVSYGEERPTCAERSDACRAQNRRDEFRILPNM